MGSHPETGAPCVKSLCCTLQRLLAATDPTHRFHRPLCSIFVALQDVHWQHGPTIVLPETHTLDFHESIKVTLQEVTYSADGSLEHVDEVREELDKEDPRPPPRTFSEDDIRSAAICCDAGSIYAMDSRAMHCGGANER